MGSPFTYTLLAVVLSVSAINSVQAWTPGVGNESATSGFTVNRQSRNDVVSFYQSVYIESEGYEGRIGWTGSVASGDAGTTSAAFKGDVQRRINYYRAMAGMSADMGMSSTSTVRITSDTPSSARPSLSTTQETAAQAAAYMVLRNSIEYRAGGGVAIGTDNPHNPPVSWVADTDTARNGAFFSSLSSNYYGPRAIDAYINENDQGAAGSANADVLHRRKILYSRRIEFSTGDVPEVSGYFSANALYVSNNYLTAYPIQFVAWPSAGFFPEPLSTKFWSLSYPEADFSSATVTMTDALGNDISIPNAPVEYNNGDDTLVWAPASGEIPSAASVDQTFNITVSNIVIGGVSQDYSYSVTIINPYREIELPALSGSLSPPDTGAQYFFNQIGEANAYRLQVATVTDGTWVEGAEDTTSSMIIDGTESSYVLRSSTAKQSGSKGFHIGLTSTNYWGQFVQLDRQFVPASDSELVFYHRKRRMGFDSRAKAEISIDDGLTWGELWGLQGDGGYASSFTQAHISLSSYVGQTIRLRFSVERPLNSSAVYWPANDASWGDYNGIHIDDVQITGSDLELVDIVETDYSASVAQVTLDASTAGLAGSSLEIGQNYRIGLRAKIGQQWFPYGPSLEVTPVDATTLTSYEVWMRGEYPDIGAFDADYDHDGISNGIERVFGLNPTDKADAAAALNPKIVNGNIQLSHAVISGETVAAELSYTLQAGSWVDVNTVPGASVSMIDGIATVSVPLSEPACYLRWTVVE